jgi:hypothetical protein
MGLDIRRLTILTLVVAILALGRPAPNGPGVSGQRGASELRSR